jgi:hypothetical protein
VRAVSSDMETALGPVTPELVLVDPALAALVRGGGPRTDSLARGPREPEPPLPRRAAAGRGRLRLVTGLLAVSLLANVALIGAASTRRPHSPAAAMSPAPALDAASPAHGIGVPASSDDATCIGPVLLGPVTGSVVRPAQPCATVAPSGIGR